MWTKKQMLQINYIMSMKCCKFVFVALMAMVSSIWADATASIFVKDAAEFKAIQKDLDALKAGLGQESPELQALWEQSNKIAQMNDRCSMISINDVLDDECSHFYAVELPEFETKYMEVTGELRLSSMKMGNTLAERTEQIKTCAAALSGIIVSKEQLLKLNGRVDLEPLSFEGAFDATYNFYLYYDSNRMKSQQKIMNLWLDKCGDIVLRKSGDEFAPLFIESVKLINDSLRNSSANLQIVVEPELLDFYLDLNKSVPGAYYLNGAQLFRVGSLPSGRSYSHLIVNLHEKTVKLPLGVDGEMQNFKGRVEFTSVYQEKDLVGRWTWGDPSGSTLAVAKGEITSTAFLGDTVAAKVDSAMVGFVDDSKPQEVLPQPQPQAKADSAASAAKAATPAPKEDSEFKIHWIPLAISGAVFVAGGVMAAVFNNKAKAESEKNPSDNKTYNDHLDKIESAQTLRTVGFGVMAAGLVGVGLTFLF